MISFTRSAAALLAPMLLVSATTAEPIIWDGPKITFSKAAFADSTDPANQDRITDSVWITRASSRGLYNAAVELSYANFSSPLGTAWAAGTTDNLGSLTFDIWENLFGVGGPFAGPHNTVGEEFVLHLTTEDIYIDLQITEWGVTPASGAGFAYTRSTPPTTGDLGGDFNQDGTVDAADYTIWRDGLGGEFGPTDYDSWRDNYGASAAVASASPEPTSLALALVVASTTLALAHSRRRLPV